MRIFRQVPSPNFTKGRNGYNPEAIVIHIMDGTLTGTDSWFQNPASQVSAHLGVGQSGEVHQYVDFANSAWHTGRVNAPVWRLIKTNANGGYINPNQYTIGIEHEGQADMDWSDAMYNASAQVIHDLSATFNIPLDRDHIIGHHEIYSLKTCPGSKVDLNRLIQLASLAISHSLSMSDDESDTSDEKRDSSNDQYTFEGYDIEVNRKIELTPINMKPQA